MELRHLVTDESGKIFFITGLTFSINGSSGSSGTGQSGSSGMGGFN